ncbi:MAG TPA: STAS domain-containing protein [Opitutus sp.]|nr:STAS domain-containing protein [Opitutus sp.]
MLHLADTKENGVRVCQLRGRLDATTSPDAEAHLAALAADASAALILDLAQLDYLSSKGLHVLLNAANRARTQGSRLALSSPRDAVKHILDISGFSSILDIHPTREQALAALAS